MLIMKLGVGGGPWLGWGGNWYQTVSRSVKSFCPGNIFWNANPFGGVLVCLFFFLSFCLLETNNIG